MNTWMLVHKIKKIHLNSVNLMTKSQVNQSSNQLEPHKCFFQDCKVFKFLWNFTCMDGILQKVPYNLQLQTYSTVISDTNSPITSNWQPKITVKSSKYRQAACKTWRRSVNPLACTHIFLSSHFSRLFDVNVKRT